MERDRHDRDQPLSLSHGHQSALLLPPGGRAAPCTERPDRPQKSATHPGCPQEDLPHPGCPQELWQAHLPTPPKQRKSLALSKLSLFQMLKDEFFVLSALINQPKYIFFFLKKSNPFGTIV